MGRNYLSIPKLQRLHRWSLGTDRQFHPTLYNGCNYLSRPGLNIIHVSKIGPRGQYYKEECSVPTPSECQAMIMQSNTDFIFPRTNITLNFKTRIHHLGNICPKVLCKNLKKIWSYQTWQVCGHIPPVFISQLLCISKEGQNYTSMNHNIWNTIHLIFSSLSCIRIHVRITHSRYSGWYPGKYMHAAIVYIVN